MEIEMSNATWKSEKIEITPSVFVDVKANANGVVLGQGNDVWFHDLHLVPEQACQIADALTQGAAKCLAARRHH
jgi:hypothetical protein